jgi:CDP-6-deoxy-D-xylo-4-hexulose-3-dehydrase
MNRDLRKRILDLVDQLAESEHARQDFHAGQTSVPVSGKVYGSQELRFLVDASMDFWLTAGRYNSQFEKQQVNWPKSLNWLSIHAEF